MFSKESILTRTKFYKILKINYLYEEINTFDTTFLLDEYFR
jgi:hypothetical protein